MSKIKNTINKTLKNKDLDVNETKLERVTKLDLSNKEIENLEGLDDLNLSNLKALLLDNNPITELKGLANIKGLEYLSLNGCKDIDNFDILKELNLKHLEIANCNLNSFEDLDFIKNINGLKELNIKDNNFDNSEDVCLSVFKDFGVSRVVANSNDQDFIMNDDLLNSGQWSYVFEQYDLLGEK